MIERFRCRCWVNGQMLYPDKEDELFLWFEQHKTDPMMFALGKYDRHGNLIYESDILKAFYTDGDTGKREFEYLQVIYDEDACAYGLKGANAQIVEFFTENIYPFNSDDYEIAGNIYDNPELMEVE